jgi:hypothetical protein
LDKREHSDSTRDASSYPRILPETGGAPRARRYLMIESAKIKNFRAFRDIELNDLKRVNIIVGDNGAGKTALLEALILALVATPEVAVRLRNWRGVDAPSGTGMPQEIYDGLFLDLFHGFDKDVTASIFLKGNADDTRSLTFQYEREGTATTLPIANVGNGAVFSTTRPYVPIKFEWEDARGIPTRVIPQLSPQGLQLPPPPQLPHDPGFLAAREKFPTSQNARWFSGFSKQGVESRFIETIRAQFPDIESLSVEVDLGNPVIFAKLPWNRQKIPLYLASDGLNKLLTILLHIAVCKQTILCVDEVENGLHHSRHAKLWEQLFSFADEYETQLFLTTHSWEYLKAAVPLMKKFPNDFAMIQVSQNSGVSDCDVIPGDRAAAGIENDIDPRGRNTDAGNSP